MSTKEHIEKLLSEHEGHVGRGDMKAAGRSFPQIIRSLMEWCENGITADIIKVEEELFSPEAKVCPPCEVTPDRPVGIATPVNIPEQKVTPSSKLPEIKIETTESDKKVFNIDVGDMPPKEVTAHLDDIKETFDKTEVSKTKAK